MACAYHVLYLLGGLAHEHLRAPLYAHRPHPPGLQPVRWSVNQLTDMATQDLSVLGAPSIHEHEEVSLLYYVFLPLTTLFVRQSWKSSNMFTHVYHFCRSRVTRVLLCVPWWCIDLYTYPVIGQNISLACPKFHKCWSFIFIVTRVVSCEYLCNSRIFSYHYCRSRVTIVLQTTFAMFSVNWSIPIQFSISIRLE
jgi:hypothetical protein